MQNLLDHFDREAGINECSYHTDDIDFDLLDQFFMNQTMVIFFARLQAVATYLMIKIILLLLLKAGKIYYLLHQILNLLSILLNLINGI